MLKHSNFQSLEHIMIHGTAMEEDDDEGEITSIPHMAQTPPDGGFCPIAQVPIEVLALILSHVIINEDKDIRTVNRAFNRGYFYTLAYRQNIEVEYLLQNEGALLENAGTTTRLSLITHFEALKSVAKVDCRDIPAVRNREQILNQLNGTIIREQMDQGLRNPNFLELNCASRHITRVPSYLFKLRGYSDFWRGVRNIDFSNNQLRSLPMDLEVLQNKSGVNIIRLNGNRLALCPRAKKLIQRQNLLVSQVIECDDAPSPNNTRKYQRVF